MTGHLPYIHCGTKCRANDLHASEMFGERYAAKESEAAVFMFHTTGREVLVWTAGQWAPYLESEGIETGSLVRFRHTQTGRTVEMNFVGMAGAGRTDIKRSLAEWTLK